MFEGTYVRICIDIYTYVCVKLFVAVFMDYIGVQMCSNCGGIPSTFQNPSINILCV